MGERDRRSIRELEAKIEELRELSRQDGLDLSEEIQRLRAKIEALRTETLSSRQQSQQPRDWEVVKLARHPKRPSTLDYLERIMDDYYELRGDRLYGDDRAIVTALAQFEGRTVVVIGHQKGHTAEENRARNFGMPHPEGYRKAFRAMELAERFAFPIVTFIDTPGAYPGIGAEERNIGGALAHNIRRMFSLTVPIVVAVVGEGGSGGALGIGVGDRIVMMENATYSVISPEGCASILWRDRARAPEAARALRMTADHLLELGVIDEIVAEPAGGAHRDPDASARALKTVLARYLRGLEGLEAETLLGRRSRRFEKMGVYEELSEVVEPSAGGSGDGA